MYDILELNKKLVSELKEIAKDLKIKRVETLRKQDLIYKILDQQAISATEKNKEKKNQPQENRPHQLQRNEFGSKEYHNRKPRIRRKRIEKVAEPNKDNPEELKGKERIDAAVAEVEASLKNDAVLDIPFSDTYDEDTPEVTPEEIEKPEETEKPKKPEEPKVITTESDIKIRFADERSRF